jgi:hypothetical protein
MQTNNSAEAVVARFLRTNGYDEVGTSPQSSVWACWQFGFQTYVDFRNLLSSRL